MEVTTSEGTGAFCCILSTCHEFLSSVLQSRITEAFAVTDVNVAPKAGLRRIPSSIRIPQKISLIFTRNRLFRTLTAEEGAKYIY